MICTMCPTGIDYNPCVVAAGALGALAVAEGIGIEPQLITVSPSGAVLVAVGKPSFWEGLSLI